MRCGCWPPALENETIAGSKFAAPLRRVIVLENETKTRVIEADDELWNPKMYEETWGDWRTNGEGHYLTTEHGQPEIVVQGPSHSPPSRT